MRRTAAGIALAAIMASVCIAGCSSDSSGGADAPTGGGASASGHSAQSPSGGGSASCKQLTGADAQPMLTRPVTTVKVSAVGVNGEGQQCMLIGKDSVGIDVLVIGGNTAARSYAQEVAREDRPVAVPGVGDRASRATEDEQIIAIKGDVYCAVSMSSSDDFPGLGPLEEAAGATIHIDERAYAAAAAALGTLCNRIFGSGSTTPDLTEISALDAAASNAPSSPGPGLPTDFQLPSDAATG